ncbi:MAG: L-fucose/L-arabinose isomerase family protein [Planctomycetota bacterium]
MQNSQPKCARYQIQLIASGDLRLSANQTCWPAQAEMEKQLSNAIADFGFELVRAHPFDPDLGHGFIASQDQGRKVFKNLDPDGPLIVAESVWQYSHHVLIGLVSHRGPILTVANWSGQWPGLVGMLNLNGSLTKAGINYSTLWSEDFGDDEFKEKLKQWLDSGECKHLTNHVIPLDQVKIDSSIIEIGNQLADEIRTTKAILGVFDEGCMGMFNAIIPDHLLNPLGIFKERLSQSALYFETMQVSDLEAEAVLQWYHDHGFQFHFGSDESSELTRSQVLLQCKMYIAAVRIADDFGCDAVGIQYQQGLKDLLPASDLVEGTLNSSSRPPVFCRKGERVLYEDSAIPHFNEVDQCAGVDGLLINRLHRKLSQPVENTLHDLRWGDADKSGTTGDYVWVFEISGSVPAEHHVGGWAGSSGYRQPAMYFPKGGSTLSGVSKPGEVIWSRIFIEDNVLKMDLGRGKAIELPAEETRRRLESTTPQWPIMHAVTYGVSRDQMMARHKANHIQVAYATDAESADQAMLARAVLAQKLGIEVSICGCRKNGSRW